MVLIVLLLCWFVDFHINRKKIMLCLDLQLLWYRWSIWIASKSNCGNLAASDQLELSPLMHFWLYLKVHHIMSKSHQLSCQWCSVTLRLLGGRQRPDKLWYKLASPKEWPKDSKYDNWILECPFFRVLLASRWSLLRRHLGCWVRRR